VSAVGQGVSEAARLVVHGDHDLYATALRTLRAGFVSTAIATAIGLPAGVALALGRFRGRRVLLAIANAGVRTPPVALGLLVWILLWPDSRWGGGPLAGLGWIYSVRAVILAQTLLVLPIVIALTASALSSVPASLLDQAQGFGASWPSRAQLAVREARVGVVAALITALGVALGAVGAIVLVGPSIGDQTLATAALTQWNSGGQDARAVASGTVLLGLFLIVAAALTTVQHRRSWTARATS
jgi:tungstate transport system permease protein